VLVLIQRKMTKGPRHLLAPNDGLAGVTHQNPSPRHVCPVWLGYVLINPLRKLSQNPSKIVSPYVKPNMKVLDLGCGMGFFSLPIAEAVGPTGKVVCVDLQAGMLDALQRRATKAHLSGRIETHQCGRDALGLRDQDESFDFALVFATLHEVPDPAKTLQEIHHLLKPGASVLLAEPKGHVTAAEFEHSIALAKDNGFTVTTRPNVRKSYAALLTKAMP